MRCHRCKNLLNARDTYSSNDQPAYWDTTSSQSTTQPLCYDCWFGIPRKRWTPITDLAQQPTPHHRRDNYRFDEQGIIKIFCGVCGESILLSSSTNILVGMFIKVWVEIELEDLNPDGTKVKMMVEKSIPRTWRCDACPACTDRYNDEVLKAGRYQGPPFLKM